jgi:hypothetical protein
MKLNLVSTLALGLTTMPPFLSGCKKPASNVVQESGIATVTLRFEQERFAYEISYPAPARVKTSGVLRDPQSDREVGAFMTVDDIVNAEIREVDVSRDGDRVMATIHLRSISEMELRCSGLTDVSLAKGSGDVLPAKQLPAGEYDFILSGTIGQ